MSALEVENEVVIFDMGVHMEKLIELNSEKLDYTQLSTEKLKALGVLPNDTILNGKNVIAIVISHGHLDHVNAIPKLAEKYNCPIIGTPYTIKIIENILRDHGKKKLLDNLVAIEYGDLAEISKKIQIELVRTTHSIPEPSLIVVHTKEGIATIAYDYKLDNTPVFGEKPDYKRIKEIGKEGVKLHLSECVHVADETRTPSEEIAKHLMKDSIDRAYEGNTSVFVTTFASHIARLTGIIEANQNRRKIVFLGRSLDNYTRPAKELNLIDLSDITIEGRPKGVTKVLSDVEKNPTQYLVVCTGNQGEPNSVLSRISNKQYTFNFRKEDQVIFSSTVIPSPLNRASRYTLERNLKSQGVRIIKDVHVSGHAMREDHRDLIRMLNPTHIIPCHGETERLANFASLAEEEGYVLGSTVHILTNGRYIDLK
ncbi:MAG: MBL fold metallo-hydrolase [DPANN group archaeon]|nr:MBL fold metallo-hydrolase [DPANN group archaeon]